jgi:four helix bundle protein
MKAQGENIDLITRTRAFALRIIRLYTSLPGTQVEQVIGRQLLRAGTSVGAHYREAQCSRSTAEFVSKLDGGRQELEETMYWLELLRDSAQDSPAACRTWNDEATRREADPPNRRRPQVPDLEPTYSEARELMAILTTCARNAKNRANRQ